MFCPQVDDVNVNENDGWQREVTKCGIQMAADAC